jgi:hypothetical protein
VSDIRPEPEDFGAPLASEAQTSFGGQLTAEWANTLDPKNSLTGGYIVRRLREGAAGGFAAHDYDGVGTPEQQMQLLAIDQAARDAIPDTPIEEARARLKQEGLEKDVHLPDLPSIKSPVLDLMVNEAHDRRDREAAIARGPNSFMPNALGFVTSMGVGMIDPVNVAAFSIPVLGEARIARMVAAGGDRLLGRAAVKAGIGAAQGAAGTAILQPADWWLHTRDGQDYTMAEAMQSIVMGAGIGGLAHAGIGGVGDIRARLRGAPLEGSPQDLLQRGLMTGTHVHADQLGEEGAPIGDVPGMENHEVPGVAPAPHSVAAVLADLPPAAKQDALHAAMADAINGTEPRAAQMLNIAADHDPRIAEALTPERIVSAAIQHEDATYAGVTHGDAIVRAAKETGRSVDDLAAGQTDESSGFLTNRGRYVGREEAKAIADGADQMSPHAPAKPELRAEDLNFDYTAKAMSDLRAAPLAREEKAAQPSIPDLTHTEPQAQPPHLGHEGPSIPDLGADRAPAHSAEVIPFPEKPPVPEKPAAPTPPDRAARLEGAAADPRWRELADVKPDYDQPDALEESRAADHVEEPASAAAPERALSALEQEAARAEEIWKQIEPTLTEAERKLVNDVLDQLKLDKDARDKIISDGVACLVGAVA